MKRLLIVITILIPVTVLLSQNKKAIIIAIGNYPVESNLRKINSNNDIPIIKDALILLGFHKNDILILKDEKATKYNIVHTLQGSFLKSLKPGDIAYFHFSGHGQQVQDFNGDELDGLDESILPYDAMEQNIAGVYEGECHLIDDELHKFFSDIRLKLGPKGHFLVTMDACHSGTVTRHYGSARGTDLMFIKDSVLFKKDKKSIDTNQDDFKNADESKMASMVAFFGSMANQLNYEIAANDGKYYGALSYAFSKAAHSLQGSYSYQELFDRIKLIIGSHNNKQIPEASGVLAQAVLGGKFDPIPEYYQVQEWLDSNKVVIDAGFLKGLSPGAVVGFYPSSIRLNSVQDIISKGIVRTAGATQAFVDIPEGITYEKSQFSRVMLLEEHFGDLLIRLQLMGGFHKADTSIFSDLFKLDYIKQVDKKPDLVLSQDGIFLKLISKSDVLIDSFSTYSTRDDLYYKFGQAQFIRNLEQENQQLKLELSFSLQTRNKRAVKHSFRMDSLKNAAGHIIIKNGDEVKIKITNKGTKPAYYTLLDIQPDNVVNVLFPGAAESPSDYYLKPGEEFIIPKTVKFSPPTGHEVFKLIATKNPVNLRPLDQRRSHNTPSTDPFETLINLSYYNEETRSAQGKTSSIPAGQVNIYSLPFIIED
jgi:metacaspase-1